MTDTFGTLYDNISAIFIYVFIEDTILDIKLSRVKLNDFWWSLLLRF